MRYVGLDAYWGQFGRHVHRRPDELSHRRKAVRSASRWIRTPGGLGSNGRTVKREFVIIRSVDVDQDPPHRLGRGSIEVAPTVPGGRGASDEAQVRLVDQGRGLERVVGALGRHPLGRGRPKLLVHDGKEIRGGLSVAAPGAVHEVGDVGESAIGFPHASRSPG